MDDELVERARKALAARAPVPVADPLGSPLGWMATAHEVVSGRGEIVFITLELEPNEDLLQLARQVSQLLFPDSKIEPRSERDGERIQLDYGNNWALRPVPRYKWAPGEVYPRYATVLYRSGYVSPEPVRRLAEQLRALGRTVYERDIGQPSVP